SDFMRLEYSYIINSMLLGFMTGVKNLFKQDNYFVSTGNKMMSSFSGLICLISIVVVFLVGGSGTIFWGFMLLIFESFIFLFITNAKPQILGRWTDEGRIAEAKCKNFKKFLSDYTLLKDKSVKDIAVWEVYLIYATAFGISDKVLKAIKVAMPDYDTNRSMFYRSAVYIPAMSMAMRSYSAGRGGGG